MAANSLFKSHKPVPAGKIGILLINLGTPDAPEFWQVRQYLDEFLSDPRVIETPQFLWWLVLNFYILNARPGRENKASAGVS